MSYAPGTPDEPDDPDAPDEPEDPDGPSGGVWNGTDEDDDFTVSAEFLVGVDGKAITTINGLAGDDTFSVSDQNGPISALSINGGSGKDTLHLDGFSGTAALSIANVETVTAAMPDAALTFAGDSALQTVSMSGGTLDLNACDASALETVELASDTGTDIIRIGTETGKNAGEDGVTILNFEGGSGGDELDVSDFFGSEKVRMRKGTCLDLDMSGGNVGFVTDTNELTAGNFNSDGITGLNANTDYIFIASSGGEARVYRVHAGDSGGVTDKDITTIATIKTTDSGSVDFSNIEQQSLVLVDGSSTSGSYTADDRFIGTGNSNAAFYDGTDVKLNGTADTIELGAVITTNKDMLADFSSWNRGSAPIRNIILADGENYIQLDKFNQHYNYTAGNDGDTLLILTAMGHSYDATFIGGAGQDCLEFFCSASAGRQDGGFTGTFHAGHGDMIKTTENLDAPLKMLDIKGKVIGSDEGETITLLTQAETAVRLAGLLDGGGGADTLKISDESAAEVEVGEGGSIRNFETVEVTGSLRSLTFAGDSALQEVDMSGTNSGTLDLDATEASALKTVTLASATGTDTITIGRWTGKDAGKDGVTISNFQGGSDGDKLNVSAFFSGSSVVGELPGATTSPTTVPSGTNVLIVTDTNELNADNFGDNGITGLAENTDYIFIASSGGTARVYHVQAGVSGGVTDADIKTIATINTTGGFDASNILISTQVSGSSGTYTADDRFIGTGDSNTAFYSGASVILNGTADTIELGALMKSGGGLADFTGGSGSSGSAPIQNIILADKDKGYNNVTLNQGANASYDYTAGNNGDVFSLSFISYDGTITGGAGEDWLEINGGGSFDGTFHAGNEDRVWCHYGGTFGSNGKVIGSDDNETITLEVEGNMTLAGLLDGGEGTDTLTIRGDAYSSSLEVIGNGSICNFETVEVGDSMGGDLLGSLTFAGDNVLQTVNMSGTSFGTLDLDATGASALETVTLASATGTDTIHIGRWTGKYAGEDGVTISNFEGGSGGDELDVSNFFYSSVVVESGSTSGFQVASGTNVLIVTDTNELDAGNFDDGGIEIAANTDYIVIASAGSGTAHIYLVNAGGDTTVTTDEITPIATIETIGSAITADNILV